MKGRKFTAKQKLKALQGWGGKTADVEWAAEKYKCAVSSLWIWKRLYDGTLDSLQNKSSRPKSPHPNAHKPDEIANIKRMLDENPHIAYTELYTELRAECAYSRCFWSMYKYIRKNLLRVPKEYELRENQPYETPDMIGIKWQMDVKYVPTICFAGTARQRFETTGERLYQYTMIDEASRERFLYGYQENSSHNTKDFIKRAVVYFGYVPHIIQTDNGLEFRNPAHAKPDTPHAAIDTMKKLGITHQLIRPYTPRHNGKVERSHRTDQERFYRYSKFDSIADLNEQMAAWLVRYNRTASTSLKNRYGKKVFQSPLDKRAELLEILAEQGGVTTLIDHKTQQEYSVRVRFLKNAKRTA